jgi:hypothetical protein
MFDLPRKSVGLESDASAPLPRWAIAFGAVKGPIMPFQDFGAREK